MIALLLLLLLLLLRHRRCCWLICSRAEAGGSAEAGAGLFGATAVLLLANNK